MSRNQQVVRYGERWAVRSEGNTRVTSIYDSKEEAVSEAKKIARNTASSVMIYSSKYNLEETGETERSRF